MRPALDSRAGVVPVADLRRVTAQTEYATSPSRSRVTALDSFAEAKGVKADRIRCTILSVQKASQRLTSVVLGLLGHAGIRYPIQAVIRPRIHVKLDRHPGAAQSIRIDHVFFEEEIKTANRNVGRRQTRHIRRSRSRIVG